MSLLERLSSHVTPGALAQSCQSWSSYLVLSLLELVDSHDSPGALAGGGSSGMQLPPW